MSSNSGHQTMRTTTLILLLFLLLILVPSFSIQAASSPGFCSSKCKKRCSLAGFMDRCLLYCGVCCSKCHCVPSGTYGNRDECPCYRDMLNSKKKQKCP
ncbi:Snakin-1 [Zostera marina]|uniref:Snakin-1 n=1 Tax=Zostera marina TaxID=29655 RepID=A0A0K9PQS8_ZOSMR|nr:Snakin-1 [Zostera marina]